MIDPFMIGRKLASDYLQRGGTLQLHTEHRDSKRRLMVILRQIPCTAWAELTVQAAAKYSRGQQILEQQIVTKFLQKTICNQHHADGNC